MAPKIHMKNIRTEVVISELLTREANADSSPKSGKSAWLFPNQRHLRQKAN